MYLEVYPQVVGVTMFKRCSKCGEQWYATAEYFRRDKRAVDGLQSACKSCDAAYRLANREIIRDKKRRHYIANRDTIAKRQREYDIGHSEERSAYKKKWATVNRERKAETDRQWRINNRARKAESTRSWYLANREKADAKIGEWRKANPHKVAEYNRRWQSANPENTRRRQHIRRARKIASGGTYTIEDLAAIRAAQTDKQGRLICWACNKPIKGTPHLDHWIPLKHGGPNDAGNLHYMHARCNLTKGAKLPTEFGRLL